MAEKYTWIAKGGKWLAAARSWLQWHCRNGERVTWGSADVLEPPLQIKDVEAIAGEAAWSQREEDVKLRDKLVAMLENSIDELNTAADTCDRWAEQSKSGKWSTHQVEANTCLANSLRRSASIARILLDKCKEK